VGTSEPVSGRASLSDPSIVRVRAVIEAGLAALEARREEVNDLNVFPVADGDTGDNMVLTLRAVLQELDRLAGASEGRTIDEIGRDEIVASVARAALLGARGNSGVILSQLIRGAAEELASRPGELVDPVLIGAALSRAADQAYGSVREPAEGTILTVVREMAHRVASELAHRPEGRLSPDATALQQDVVIVEVIQAALDAGQASVARGPDRLPALRDAGVVDAGGFGLVVLMAGIVSALQGSEAPPRPAEWAARASHPHHSSQTFRYCTNFAVTGQGLTARDFVEGLEAIGDSVLVVGDATTLKIHVHTDDPDVARALFAGAGEVSHLDVADMSEQIARHAGSAVAVDPAAPVSALLALADGAGLAEMFEGFGARVIRGKGIPGTTELLAAIHDLNALEVVVLPNRPDALAQVRRAAELSETPVTVVASQSPQAGLAAAAAHVPGHHAADTAVAMSAAMDRVRTGSVGPVPADDPQGRFAAGDALGLVDGEPVAWGEPAATLREVLARLGAGAEVVSCLSGAQAPLGEEAVRGLVPGAAPLTQTVGGQASTWWLLSAQ
jgi:hypothetical protein